MSELAVYNANENESKYIIFKINKEVYAIDVKSVNNIIQMPKITQVPSSPKYYRGVINLRGEIIPIIDLHKRFKIQAAARSEDIEMEGGFIILNIDGSKIGIIIDKVERVVSVKGEDVKDPPQMLSGIGTEYIEGVVREESGYLIMLNTRKLFNAKELQKIIENQ